MGLTKVLCVVRGPCEVGRRSEELPDRYVYIKCLSMMCGLFIR